MQISGGAASAFSLPARLIASPESPPRLKGNRANLDAASEEKILEVLANLAPTRIIVAHRSHLLTIASIVYEVCDGKVLRIR